MFKSVKVSRDFVSAGGKVRYSTEGKFGIPAVKQAGGSAALRRGTVPLNESVNGARSARRAGMDPRGLAGYYSANLLTSRPWQTVNSPE